MPSEMILDLRVAEGSNDDAFGTQKQLVLLLYHNASDAVL